MRTMLSFVVFVASLAFLPTVGAADVHPDLGKLRWLLGDWNRVDLPEGRSGVEWWKTDGAAYAGMGSTREGSKTIFEETLRLEATDDGVFYVVTGVDGVPVRFRMRSASERGATFENPRHDFPKRIEYRLDGDRLEATISGDGNAQTFRFRRASR